MYEIRICSDIVSDEEQSDRIFFGCPAGVTFSNISETLAAMPAEETDIHLRIFSRGGSVREGWAIVDALRATGKKIIATIEGDIASMASVVLLAASERRALPHARILIHRPYIGYFPGALNDKTAEELRKTLADETTRMLDFYVERTGASREALETLIDEERYISAEEAKELGFISEIVAPLSANHRNKITNHKPIDAKMKEDAKTKDKNLLERLIGALKSVFEVVGYDITTATGDTLTIETEEGKELAVGDPASPDGEHVLPDGRTVVVADGAITEIREAAEEPTNEPDDEVAKLQERISALEEENEELKKQVKSEADNRILAAVALAGGEEWLKKATKSPTPKIVKKAKATTKAIEKEERETWATRRRAQLKKNDE